MAARRQPAHDEAVERPSAQELADAIERWRDASTAARLARDVETDARVALVDLLRRAGLKGLVL